MLEDSGFEAVTIGPPVSTFGGADGIVRIAFVRASTATRFSPDAVPVD